MLKRYKNSDIGKPFPQEPFVLDIRAWDIDNTMMSLIRNLPKYCVAVSLRNSKRYKTLWRCERVARQKGVRILWMEAKLDAPPGTQSECETPGNE